MNFLSENIIKNRFPSGLGIVFVVFLISNLTAGEYHVDKSRQNLVKFVSDAPIEDFEGVTDKIDGYIYWEDEDLTKKSVLYFEVDLNAIDTGFGLRNRHMRENYLHTDKFPITHYTGKIIKAVNVSDTEVEVTTEGEIFIHGVKKSLSVVGTLKKEENEIYHIEINFVVTLTDFDIEVPSIMFYKIDENMDLILDFYVIKIEKSD
jgi:polyisoprenoid-binding protein YceI